MANPPGSPGGLVSVETLTAEFTEDSSDPSKDAPTLLAKARDTLVSQSNRIRAMADENAKIKKQVLSGEENDLLLNQMQRNVQMLSSENMELCNHRDALQSKLSASEMELDRLQQQLKQTQDNDSRAMDDLVKEYSRLGSENEEKESKIILLTTQLEEKAMKVNTLEATLQQVAQGTTAADENIKATTMSLYQEIDGLQKKLQAAVAAKEAAEQKGATAPAAGTGADPAVLAEKDSEIKALQDQVAALKQSASSGEAAIASTLEKTQEELKASRAETAALKTSLEGEKASLTAKLESTTVELSDIRVKLEATESEKSSAAGSKASLEGEVAALTQKLAALGKEKDEAAQKVESLTGQLANAAASSDEASAALQKELGDARSEVAALKSSIAEKEAEANAKGAEAEKLQADLKRAREDLDSAGSNQSELETTLSDTKDKLGKAESDLAAVRAEVESLKKELEGKTSELEKSRSELEDTRKSLEDRAGDVEKKLAATVEELDGTKAKLESTEKDLADIKAQLEDKTKEAADSAAAVGAAEDKIKGLEGDLATANAGIADLNKAKDALENDLKDKTSEAEGLGKDLAAANESIESLKNTEKSLNEKVSGLEGDVSRLSESNAKLEEDMKKNKAAMEKMNATKASVLDKVKTFTAAQREDKEAIRKDVNGMASELKTTLGEVEEKVAGALKDMKEQVKKAEALKDEYHVGYRKEMAERKKLHNKVMDLQGNIRVFCRVRPMLDIEFNVSGNANITHFREDDELTLETPDAMISKKYEFDRVYGPDTTQEQVFADTQPLATSVMDGYNVCIFAYGQTGSGKTHTMEGTPEKPGINIRTVSELFKIKEKRERDIRYTIKVSVVEIYNDDVRDLLADKKEQPKKVEVRQGPTGNYIQDLTEVEVTAADAIRDIMKTGQSNRAVGSHNYNEHSSRSHLIVTLDVEGRNLTDKKGLKGKLHLIDLAGSERIAKTGATGDRLTEAQAINKSLSALGDVIAALANKAKHIPFRNSKLTWMLKDSLSGDSKVLMFSQISPSVHNLSESQCTVQFATRARSVELGTAKKNVEGADVGKLKERIRELEEKCGEGSLKKAGSKADVASPSK